MRNFTRFIKYACKGFQAHVKKGHMDSEISCNFIIQILQMVDAWGGWSQFQVLLQTLKRIASKHGVSIPVVAVRYILDQVKSLNQSDTTFSATLLSIFLVEWMVLIFVLFGDFQPAVAGSMIGVRLGLAEHIQDTNAIFMLSLDEDDVNSIQEVTKKGKDLLGVIGDCGDEYRRWFWPLFPNFLWLARS